MLSLPCQLPKGICLLTESPPEPLRAQRHEPAGRAGFTLQTHAHRKPHVEAEGKPTRGAEPPELAHAGSDSSAAVCTAPPPTASPVTGPGGRGRSLSSTAAGPVPHNMFLPLLLRWKTKPKGKQEQLAPLPPVIALVRLPARGARLSQRWGGLRGGTRRTATGPLSSLPHRDASAPPGAGLRPRPPSLPQRRREAAPCRPAPGGPFRRSCT